MQDLELSGCVYPADAVDNLLAIWAEEGFAAVQDRLESLDEQLKCAAAISFHKNIIYNEGYFPGQGSGGRKGLSIVVPLHNQGKYLRKLFATISRQTLIPQLIEVVFVAYGEDDSQPRILSELAALAPFATRILRLATNNKNLAINIGLLFALRQYFCVMDARDSLQANCLLAMYERAAHRTIVLAPILNEHKGRIQIDAYGKAVYAALLRSWRIDLAPAFSVGLGKLVPRYMARGITYPDNLWTGAEIVFWTQLLATNQCNLVTTLGRRTQVAYIRHEKRALAKYTSLPAPELVTSFIQINDYLAQIKTSSEADARIVEKQSRAMGAEIGSSLFNDEHAILAFAENCQNPHAIVAAIDSYLNLHAPNPSLDSSVLYLLRELTEIQILNNKIALKDYKQADKERFRGEIDQLTEKMQDHYRLLGDAAAREWRQKISEVNFPIFNKSVFGKAAGIAFCHSFPPLQKVSGNVAARRLAQISRLHRDIIKWRCLAMRGDGFAKDNDFNMWYAKYQYASLELVGNLPLTPPQHMEWGRLAFQRAMQGPAAQVIYSHAWEPASHLAALAYKQAHPHVVWYAEFCDPMYLDHDGKPRQTALNYDRQYNGNYYAWLESEVIKKADCVIFSNRNQRELMLEQNPQIENKPAAYAKSLSLIAPRVPRQLRDIIWVDYKLDRQRLNIAYFGAVYPRRDLHSLLDLARAHAEICVHLFILHSPKCLAEVGNLDNVIVNPTQNYLQTLNIASQMDLLYIEDLDYEAGFNPFLPSKLIDYLAVGKPILAKRQPGSVLSRLKHRLVIDLADFEEFYSSWRRQQ